MSEAIPPFIISDLPEERGVDFYFNAYAKTIADLISNKVNQTPLSIGVYGAWGSGRAGSF